VLGKLMSGDGMARALAAHVEPAIVAVGARRSATGVVCEFIPGDVDAIEGPPA
jgi:hypothetical protein